MPYKDPKKQSEYMRRHQSENLEKHRERQRRYRAADPEKQRKATQKYRSDPFKRLQANLRTSLYASLKNRRIPKTSSLSNLLDCTIEYLVEHLESKFQEGMSWENQGKWHVDHIRPLASFDLSDQEQLKQAWNYTNLQPLWAEENLRKNRKYAIL